MDKRLFAYDDSLLLPYLDKIREVSDYEQRRAEEIGDLDSFACGHMYYGMHTESGERIFREWAPNATEIYLIGDFSLWKPQQKYAFARIEGTGDWELRVPLTELPHGTLYKLLIRWQGGEGERIPAWTNRAVQDEQTKIFSAQVWDPDKPYNWKNPRPISSQPPLIYEAHVGMAVEEPRIGSYREFADNIVPRIAGLGYNTIQLMAVQEHPYYGSFGYHVSSLFAPSSRFGTPDDLKYLVDKAHGLGLRVIMDLIHSHAVKNVDEGLNLYAGDPGQFFHSDQRRIHPAWDSLCYDYGKNEVLHFLLSNCKYWISEYRMDGFRFDGVTSMLYTHHGLNRDFTDYSMYYDGSADKDAMVYLMLANTLVHGIDSDLVTVAEEMSGMPGVAVPVGTGGMGFDYRLAMGTPDYWIKLIKEVSDQDWNVGEIFYELTRKRKDERTIGYLESHDQAIVGDKTVIFRLLDSKMYDSMDDASEDLTVDRGMSLHKILRLATLATAGNGYLNFMGNEFGHPEWIDFPREGNGWSYSHARRQWSLADNPKLKFHFLQDFDKAMIRLVSGRDGFFDSETVWVHDNKPAQVLVIERSGLLFVFNFNPTESFADYKIEVNPGKYAILLSSDDVLFGGQGRVDTRMLYYTAAVDPNSAVRHNNLSLYLPARSAIVLEREETMGVRRLLQKQA